MGLLENKKEETVTAVTVTDDNSVRHVDTSISFEEHVARFRSNIGSNRKRTIKTIWEIGAFICVLKDNKTYGGKTVESFIEAMDDEAVSKSEAYKWAQFAERYTVEQVNELLSYNNIGWGVVSNLIRVKNMEARKALEEKVHSGELSPGKIQDVVSSLNKQLEEATGGSDSDSKNKGSKGPGLTTNMCVANFKKVNNFLEKLLQSMDSCAKDIDDLSALLDDEARYEKAVDVMEEFQRLLPGAIEKLKELEERLSKTI